MTYDKEGGNIKAAVLERLAIKHAKEDAATSKDHVAACERALAQHLVGPKEIRITDPKTGGQKCSKPETLGAIDPMALRAIAEVAYLGTQKYDRMNYMKGYDWSLSFDALQRHLMAFWGGEDLDQETGLPHTAHAAWHCLALTTFLKRDLGTDDRYTPPTS